MNIQAHGTSPLWHTQIRHQASVTLNSRAGADAHACVPHFPMGPWRAQLLECAQTLRSHAAFKRTLDHVRKHKLGCTRDAELPEGCFDRPLEQRPKYNTWSPAAAFIYIAQNIFAIRTDLPRHCAPSAAIKARGASTFES